MKTIENEYIKVEVNECGAELYSIVRKSDGREFLWQGNPEYWKRRSPVLFPIVGAVWNNEMRVGESKYCLASLVMRVSRLFRMSLPSCGCRSLPPKTLALSIRLISASK